MSIGITEFILDPEARSCTTDALAQAACEEISTNVNDGEYVNHWLPPKGNERLLLRNAHCERLSSALVNYFAPNIPPNAKIEMVSSADTGHGYSNLPQFEHIMVRYTTEDGMSSLILDPTWGQFLRWRGLTPQWAVENNLDRNHPYRHAGEIATFWTREGGLFAKGVARLAYDHGIETSNVPRTPLYDEPSDTGKLDAATERDLVAAYERIWNDAELLPYPRREGFRQTYSSDRIAAHMKQLT